MSELDREAKHDSADIKALGDFASSAILNETLDVGRPKPIQSPAEAIGDGAQAMLYSWQSLANGALQNLNHVGAGHFVNEINLVNPPESDGAFSAAWVGETIGQGLALGATYFAFRGALKGGTNVVMRDAKVLSADSQAANELEPRTTTAATNIFDEHPVVGSTLKNLATGALYSGLTTNVQTDSDKDFWATRAFDAGVGGLTFAALGGGARAIKEGGRSLNLAGYGRIGTTMKDSMFANVTAGLGAGALSAEVSSARTDGRPATLQELGDSMLKYSVTGLAMGAIAKPFEPKLVNMPLESRRTSETGTLQERIKEGKSIQREANKYGEPMSWALPRIAAQSDLRVLAMGEVHLAHESELRDEIAKALPAMNKSGVTMMAEELPAGTQPYIDNYMSSGTFDFPSNIAGNADVQVLQIFSGNTSFMKELETARSLDMKVYAVARPYGSQEPQDNAMATRVSTLLEQNPGQKLIWTGGNFHAQMGASVAASNEETFVSQLERIPTLRGKVVSFGSMTNTLSSNDNLGPSLKYVSQPVIVPTVSAKVISDLPSYDRPMNGVTPKIGQWDYVMLLPRKVKGLNDK